MTDPKGIQPLKASELSPVCDPASVAAVLKEKASAPGHLYGQRRGLDAIEFGAGIARPGFNVFILGSRGSGRRTAARDLAKTRAAATSPPDDWVYVHNFAKAWCPTAIRLPAGMATPLSQAISAMVTDLRHAIPALFESEEYHERRREIDEAAEEEQTDKMNLIRDKAQAESIGIIRTPMGFALTPLEDGEVVKPEVFNARPEADRKKVQNIIEALQEDLTATLQDMPAIEKHRREQVRSLNAEMAATVIDASIKAVRDQFEGIDAVASRLEDVRADLLDRVEVFITKPDGRNEMHAESAFPETSGPVDADPRLRRYLVNPIIANNGDAGRTAAPVVDEDHPTLSRLVGHVEHRSRMGALETDFLMIRPGALHRANGGFLIIDALRLLREPLAWNALKRTLRSGRIEITSLAEELSLVSTVSLEPRAIPLDLKVILIGDRMLYYLLAQFDPEFSELFKIEADFDDEIPWDAATTTEYARMVRAIMEEDDLMPLDADAMAAVLVEAAREAGDAERLTMRIGRLKDLLHEADHRTRSTKADVIDAATITRTVDERTRRADRLREKSHEMITRDIRLIDTGDAKVGQINGLSVLQVGDTAFGQPTRITARARMGAGKVIDIERETKLGGPIHSKGVLILSSYLAATYALNAPVSLWASLVFEQSYGGVEGDSASSAELYALLSALSGVPIRQSLAVTGSVNQLGEVQAIGGVNEKIEGFFDICAARGLTGDQGVLIPRANTVHLVLRKRVIDAVRDGKFHVYTVTNIDQGMELLTGMEAGIRSDEGMFTPHSINGLVEARLQAFADARRAFGDGDTNDSGEEDG
ncbi:MAG: ATP-binding protein [Pseudomonadota bacterium]